MSRVTTNIRVSFKVAGRGPWEGEVLDLSRTGARLRINPDTSREANLAEDLQLVLDLSVGSTKETLSGVCKWVKEASGNAMLVGVEFAGSDRDRAAQLVALSEQQARRPYVVRAAAITSALVAAALVLGSAAAIHNWSTRHEAEIQQANAALKDAVDSRRDLSAKLAEAEKRNDPQAASLRTELKKRRKQVGAKSVALVHVQEQARGVSYPVTAELLTARGDRFFAKGNLSAAMTSFAMAVDHDPNLAGPYLKIGMINELYGLEEQALENYVKFLTLDPDANEAYEVRKRIETLLEKVRPAAKESELQILEGSGAVETEEPVD